MLALGLLFAAAALSTAQNRIYVRAGATGANTGQSWADAHPDLQSALLKAQSGDTVWVAEGAYFPTSTTDRNVSFEPKSGTRLFGGFAGAESSLAQRHWETHPTVLSGDIGQTGDSTDNSYNVVYLHYPEIGTLMDGFIVRDGNADSFDGDAYDRIRCGGGMYIYGEDWEAYPDIRNCTFVHNTARNLGGAVMVNGTGEGSAAPRFIHCRIADNRSVTHGGGIARLGGSWIERGNDLDGCIFERNEAGFFGGGFYYYDSERSDRLDIHGCRFEANEAGKIGSAAALWPGRLINARWRIDSTTFSLNKRSNGGGILHFLSANFEITDSLVIDRCRFLDHYSSPPTSILHIDQLNYGNGGFASLANTVFENNKVSSGYIVFFIFYEGKKIVFDNVTVKNNASNAPIMCGSSTKYFIAHRVLISGNSATLPGGATIWYHSNKNVVYDNCEIKNQYKAYPWLHCFTGTDSCRIINSTIVNNAFTPTNSDPIKSLSVVNSIITGIQNPAVNIGPESAKDFSYSYFDNLDCSNLPLGVTCGPGNIIGIAPMFISPDSGDYRLQPCSPLVNAGSNAYVSPASATDLAGQPRIQGGTVDIGAYETPAPAPAAAPAVLPACSGKANGAVAVPVAGGCPPLAYAWTTNTGQTGNSLSSLKAGTYALTATDQRGSSFSLAFTVPDSNSVALSPAASPIVCGDSLGGTVFAHPSGGLAPYLFDWQGSLDMDSSRSLLPPGLYAVTVQDARGCTASAVAELKIQGSLASTVAISPIRCFGAADGSITLLPKNGKAPFHWFWQGGPAGSGPTLAPLGPGEYRVTLTDDFGCQAQWVLPLSQPDSLFISGELITPASDSMTADGSIALTVQGGTLPYKALWSGGAGQGLSVSGLLPGAYVLALTDANNCSLSATVVVGVTSGTSEPGAGSGFSVLPNPTEGPLRVLLAEPAQVGCSLSLFDAAGRLMGAWQVPTGVQQLALDWSGLPSGVYWARLASAKGAAGRRVMKD